MRAPDNRFQIGLGKVEELAQLVRETHADKVIFDNALKPLQAYNLAKATKVENIDRFELILEIFTKRATTSEAQLQIQLARLRRNLAQAKEKVRLTKKGEQPGFMGLGAYEADVYYDSVKKGIHTIRRRLRKIREKRILHRDRRTELGFTSISLAGYTKAGKSSLFNALTQETVRVDEQLFTTLSTTTRLITIRNKKFLLTDTVGFINHLPLALIDAFHSTLEETIYSDLILLLVDVSEPLPIIEKKLATCIETIERIGAAGIPTITLLNKTDLTPERELEQKIEALKEKATKLVPISALRKTNLDQLCDEILEMLKNYVQVTFTISLSKDTQPFMAWLYRNTDVKEAKYNEDSVNVTFESNPTTAEKVRSRVEREFKGKVEKLQRLRTCPRS